MKKYYQDNKERLRTIARERAQSKRSNSDSNLQQFEKDTEFGPEFICVCRHAGLFENQVVEFTDERKNKIGEELLKLTCEFKTEFYDPKQLGRYLAPTHFLP